MKYTGIIKGPDASFAVETFDFEAISRNKAMDRVRRELHERSVPGASAELYQIIRDTDSDLVCKWNVDDIFVIKEQIIQ